MKLIDYSCKKRELVYMRTSVLTVVLTIYTLFHAENTHRLRLIHHGRLAGNRWISVRVKTTASEPAFSSKVIIGIRCECHLT